MCIHGQRHTTSKEGSYQDVREVHRKRVDLTNSQQSPITSLCEQNIIKTSDLTH
jgi:hypothetical protein